MKISLKPLFVIMLVVAISFSTNLPNQALSTNSNNIKSTSASAVLNSISTTTLTNHSAISITQNSDFALNNFTGSGTKASPYVFQNYNITLTSTTSNAIDIRNTNAYFIIRDNYLSMPASNNVQNAISLNNVSNGVISGNTYNNFGTGIYSNIANNLIISNNNNNYNDTSLNFAVVDIEYTNNSIVSNNLANKSIYGIFSNFNINVTFSNNNLFNSSTYGIESYFDVNATFSNNTIVNAVQVGIYANAETNVTFVGNFISKSQKSGIDVESANQGLVFINNTVEFSNIGVRTGVSNPVSNVIFENNIIANSTNQGINLYHITNVTLTGNTVYGNGYQGILLQSADTNVNITSNFMNQNYDGLDVDISSVNVTIFNNTITQNGNDGINLDRWNSQKSGTGVANAVIMNNTISQSYYYGMEDDNSNNNTIIYNNFINNSDEGICFWASNYTNVYLNSFINNYAAPAQICESTGLINYFDNGHFGNYYSNYNGTDTNHDGIGDTNYTIDQTNHNDTMPLMHPAYLSVSPLTNKVIDEGATNQQISLQLNTYDSIKYSVSINQTQFSGTIYNSTWSKSIQQSLDGLGLGTYRVTFSYTDVNTSLTFQSTALITVKDVTAPVLTVSSHSISYVAGTTGHTINVTASDLHPASYIVYENGSQVASGAWNESVAIQVSIDGLSAGYYVFKIVVFDTSNNSANVTVNITVTPAPSSTTPTSSSVSTVTNTSSSKSGKTPSFEVISTLMGLVILIGFEIRRRK